MLVFRASGLLRGTHTTLLGPQLTGVLQGVRWTRARRSQPRGAQGQARWRAVHVGELLLPQCAKEIHGVSGLCFCTEGLREGFIKKTILEQGFEGEKVLDLLRG